MYQKVDDYNNRIGTVLEGNDTPEIYVNYSWMYGRDQYKSSIDHAENLADAALGLNLDCIRSNIILNTEDGTLPMVPVFANTYGMLVNNSLFEKEGLSVPKTYDELISACNEFREKGYENPIMGFTNEETTSIFTLLAYPYFCGTVAEDAEAVEKLNSLDASAGEYMRPTIEKIVQFLNDSNVNLEACAEIENNYEAVILRFFEGDVPMMIGTADTISGTKKRESQSDAFTKTPFKYTFTPIPLTDDGGYFIDSPSVQFSVNKNCENLDMANEFMRFLIVNEELNAMASVKRLVSPTTELPLDSVYAPFGQVPAERIISPEALGIMDPLTVQIRQASFQVGRDEITVDEAVEMYGTFE